jgi:hypothetical protein
LILYQSRTHPHLFKAIFEKIYASKNLNDNGIQVYRQRFALLNGIFA